MDNDDIRVRTHRDEMYGASLEEMEEEARKARRKEVREKDESLQSAKAQEE